MTGTSQPAPEVAAVVLAAGASTRMGRPKLLLRWQGQTLLRRAVEAAVGACRRVVVVVGPEADRMRAEVASLPVVVVTNPDYPEGIASSLRRGLKEVGGAAAVLVTLADQPHLTAQHLRRLVDTYRDTQAPVVAASYRGTVGVPAVFAREVFPQLLSLRGDAGAKRVVEAFGGRAVLVPLPEAEVDVDTPEDWERLRAQDLPSSGEG